MRIFPVFCLGLFFSLTLLGNSVAFNYELKGYPKSNDVDCHTAAMQLGDQFSAATGLKVQRSICMADTQLGWDISIRYESTKPLEPASNFDPYAGIFPMGRYKKRKICEADLNRVVNEFETVTGLKPVFSFCTKTITGRGYPWAPRVDAFGTPKLNAYHSGYMVYGVPKGITGKDYRERVRKAMTDHGAVFSALISHSSMSFGTYVVHYFAKKQLDFEMKEFTKTDKLKHCEAQLVELDEIFAKTKNPPAVTNCGYVNVGGAWEPNAVFIGGSPLRARKTIEKYQTYEECESARPALVAYYQNTLKLDVYGGLCSRDSRVFRVVVFEP